MKKCYICNKTKQDDEFFKMRKSKDGLGHYCKECHQIKKQNNKRTKEGLCKDIYYHQKKTSIKRGHKEPSYSLLEFINWCLNNIDFNNLFDNWASNGYKKYDRPSTDRLNDFVGYSFDNIRIITWRENDLKGHKDRMMGVGTQGKANCKKVMQFDKSGNFIAEYYSIMEAERQTGVSGKHIPSVCNGKRKYAGGFIWKHYPIKEEQAL